MTDPKLRLADMDSEKIDVAVLFGAGLAGDKVPPWIVGSPLSLLARVTPCSLGNIAPRDFPPHQRRRHYGATRYR